MVMPVALALGELDPNYEGKLVILAYEGGEPPASSTALRLVVPGDVHGGRSVRDVAPSTFAKGETRCRAWKGR
jgi:hypothetical protein